MGAVGSALHCCEVDVTQHTLKEMKRLLEGERKRVNSSPEVYVTIEEMQLKDGGKVNFSPVKFNLTGMHFKTLVEVHGTASELAAIAGAKGAHAVMNKMGVSDETKEKVHGVGAKAAAAVGGITSKVTSGGKDKRSEHIEITVNMTKEFGDEEVKVDVTDFQTGHAAINKMLGVEKARKFVEDAISAKASEAATKMAKKHVGQVQSKVEVVKSKVGEKVGEIAGEVSTRLTPK